MKRTNANGLTKIMQNFVDKWKSIVSINFTRTNAEIIDLMAEEMQCSKSYVNKLRYDKRIAPLIDEFQNKFVANRKEEISIHWVVDEMKQLYNKMDDTNPVERKDKINLLSKLSDIMQKYQGKLQDEMANIEAMSMKDLIDKFADSTKVLFGNENVAKMMRDALLFKSNNRSVE